MFPWPLAAGFLAFGADDEADGVGAGFFDGGGASSSENDSQPGSWIVTNKRVSGRSIKINIKR